MNNKLIFFLFSEECMTTESEPCIFPFKHEGKWQRTCIDVENESVCATMVDDTVSLWSLLTHEVLKEGQYLNLC